MNILVKRVVLVLVVAAGLAAATISASRVAEAHFGGNSDKLGVWQGSGCLANPLTSITVSGTNQAGNSATNTWSKSATKVCYLETSSPNWWWKRGTTVTVKARFLMQSVEACRKFQVPSTHWSTSDVHQVTINPTDRC